MTKTEFRDFSRCKTIEHFRACLKKHKPKVSRAIKLQRGRAEEKRLSAKGETNQLRADVFARAAGFTGDEEFCELHGGEVNPLLNPRELHHLEGGSGRRTEQQSVSNCVAACRVCHRAYHRNPETFRDRVTAWAKFYGYPIPARFRVEREQFQATGSNE